MKIKIITAILLFIIFTFALFFRIYFSYNQVISSGLVKYAADDGIYTMRLVENTLLGKHFPLRIYFDPFTYFPYGTFVYFAPLFDQLLSLIIWLATFGKPTLEAINLISPFYPPVLGSLIIFLVYFIGKALWNREIALLSAFLAGISAPLLFRSVFGATDHHIGEAFFSTLAIMFLIFTIQARKKQKLIQENENFVQKIKAELTQNRKFWIFTLLSGFSLGLYFLTWTGALLFLFIFFLFIIFYYLSEFFQSRNSIWILAMGVVIFFIVFLMLFPFFGHPDFFHSNIYNMAHLISLLLGIFGFVITGTLGLFIRKKKIKFWFFPFLLLFAGILIILLLKIFLPLLFDILLQSFLAVNTSLSPSKFARFLTGEMVPLKLNGAFDYFSAHIYIFFLALPIIFYKFIKNKKPEYLLVFIWSVVIVLMTGIIPILGQRKYIYYLAVNVSLLTAFLVVEGFKFGWQGLKISQRAFLESPIKKYLTIGSIFIIFNSIFFLFFPFPFNIANPFPRNLPDIFANTLTTAKEGTILEVDDWYKTMEWLKENTPDPGLDYYGLYQEPSVNKNTGKINPYSYPPQAYGIVARWDVGHLITYYAHRIPIANPFHQGTGAKENGEVKELGAGVFFLETDEEKAINYLNELRTKYIVTDYDLILPDIGFKSLVKWVQGNTEGYLAEKSNKEPSKYDNSMVVRLHVLDGREETTEREVEAEKIKFYIKPLNHFRLVYESPSTAIPSSKDYPNEIKAIKVFEYVKGAKISGKTKKGSKVYLSTEIKTNQGRTFIYEKSFEAKDGYFEFIAPYSNSKKEPKVKNENQSYVSASDYRLKRDNKEILVSVPEEYVIEGKSIEITI